MVVSACGAGVGRGVDSGWDDVTSSEFVPAVGVEAGVVAGSSSELGSCGVTSGDVVETSSEESGCGVVSVEGVDSSSEESGSVVVSGDAVEISSEESGSVVVSGDVVETSSEDSGCGVVSGDAVDTSSEESACVVAPGAWVFTSSEDNSGVVLSNGLIVTSSELASWVTASVGIVETSSEDPAPCPDSCDSLFSKSRNSGLEKAGDCPNNCSQENPGEAVSCVAPASPDEDPGFAKSVTAGVSPPNKLVGEKAPKSPSSADPPKKLPKSSASRLVLDGTLFMGIDGFSLACPASDWLTGQIASLYGSRRTVRDSFSVSSTLAAQDALVDSTAQLTYASNNLQQTELQN